jgi:phage terminase large subunit-like protein
MLRIVPPDGQIVKPEDIHYADEDDEAGYRSSGTFYGVDLAISKKQTADYTAIVGGVKQYHDYQRSRLSILPQPINRRMDFAETIQQILFLSEEATYGGTFFVENVSFQQYAIEVLQRKGARVIGMRPGSDKQARLMVAAKFIKDGSVVFPRTGCEHLLRQLFNLGTEKHDDLVDGLVYLILGTLAQGSDLQKIVWLDLN